MAWLQYNLIKVAQIKSLTFNSKVYAESCPNLAFLKRRVKSDEEDIGLENYSPPPPPAKQWWLTDGQSTDGINLTKLTDSSGKHERRRADQTRSASVAAFFAGASPVGLKQMVLCYTNNALVQDPCVKYKGVEYIMSNVLCAMFWNLHSLPFLPISPLWCKFQNKSHTELSTQ